jgi:hypothetical protein
MRFSPALAAVTAAVLAVPGGAVAGNVSPTSKEIVSANASVSSCGSLSSMTISWTVVDGIVTSIALGSIPAACNAGTLSLTLVNSSNTSLGTAGPVTITGTSQTLSAIASSPDATAVATSYLSVVGP